MEGQKLIRLCEEGAMTYGCGSSKHPRRGRVQIYDIFNKIGNHCGQSIGHSAVVLIFHVLMGAVI